MLFPACQFRDQGGQSIQEPRGRWHLLDTDQAARAMHLTWPADIRSLRPPEPIAWRRSALNFRPKRGYKVPSHSGVLDHGTEGDGALRRAWGTARQHASCRTRGDPCLIWPGPFLNRSGDALSSWGSCWSGQPWSFFRAHHSGACWFWAWPDGRHTNCSSRNTRCARMMTNTSRERAHTLSLTSVARCRDDTECRPTWAEPCLR